MSFKLTDIGKVVIDNAENAIGLGWVTDLLARKGSMTALAKAHPITKTYADDHDAELKNVFGFEQMEPQLRTLLQAMLAAHKATSAAEAAAESKKDPLAAATEAESKAAAEAAEAAAEAAEAADRKLLAAHFDFFTVTQSDKDNHTNPLVKDMLVAFLNEDKSAFKKAFASFKSEKCKEDPKNYVKDLGNADDAYNNLYIALKNTGSKCFDEQDLVGKLSLQEELNVVAKNVLATLDEQNKVNLLDVEFREDASERDKAIAKKRDAESSKRATYFVNKDMQAKFDEYKSGLDGARDALKAAKKTQTKEVLESTEGKVNYAIARVKSIFVTLNKVAEELEVTRAENALEAAQDKFDTAKAAQGWVFGFYLTPEFKKLITEDLRESQLKNALEYTKVKEVPGMSTLRSIGSSFEEALSAVKSFSGKVGVLFARAWESLKGMFKAASSKAAAANGASANGASANGAAAPSSGSLGAAALLAADIVLTQEHQQMERQQMEQEHYHQVCLMNQQQQH